VRAAAILVLAVVTARGQAPSPARRAELAGDFPAAEKAYEEEVKTRPSAETWQRLGLVRHLQSKFDPALPAFHEALRLNPSLWTSRLFLGICLYRVNRFDEARTELERASRQVPSVDPGRDEIDYWLGATLVALKQPFAGLMAIERLLVRKPSRLDALELATRAYGDLGSGLWNRVAEQSFESAPGYEVHGHALEAEGNVEGALDAYRHSNALDPRRTGPRTAIGRLLLSKGKAAEARAALDQELKLVPADPQASYYAALAAIQLGQMAEAAPLLETAARWAKMDPEPSIALAQVYLALGQRERAAEAARSALAIAPNSAAARELLHAADPAK
jgi:tetratricopeptide (TPR) repeat protein